MSIESGLATHLFNTASVTAFVSTRIYPSRIPDPTTATPTTFPCLVYNLISEPVFTSFDGAQLFAARVQIDAWATSYKSAHDTAAAVHSALQGYRGAMDVYQVGGIFRQRKNDMSDPDLKLYRISMDYMINYS